MKPIHKGWRRLGVVLTIVWVLSITGYAIYEWRTGFCATNVFSDGYPDTSTFHKGTSDDPIPLVCYFKKVKFLSVTLIPVAGIWTIILVVLPAARWVYDGFKSA